MHFQSCSFTNFSVFHKSNMLYCFLPTYCMTRLTVNERTYDKMWSRLHNHINLVGYPINSLLSNRSDIICNFNFSPIVFQYNQLSAAVT